MMTTRNSQRTGVSTFAIRTIQRTEQKLQKSFHLSNAEKNFNFFPNAFKKIKHPTHNLTMTLKLNNDNGLQRRTTRTTGYNTVLAKKGLKEVIEQLCYYQLLYIYSTDGFQMPLLRQYPKR